MSPPTSKVVSAAPRRHLRFRRLVALTFDDGPSPWTAPILDALRDGAARATFFVLGCSVDDGSDTLRRAVSEGHELGNHLYSHSPPERLDDAALEDELRRTAEAVARATGTVPRLVRPPYLGEAERVARAASRLGLGPAVTATVDPSDWREPDAEVIVDRVLASLRRGAIICLHDGAPPGSLEGTSRAATVEAVSLLVDELARRRYRAVTVSELLR